MTKPIKRVVLFGIDGAGTFFEQANTPNIDRIFKNGAISHRTLTENPTVSAECWGAMLHGVDCKHHRLSNWVAANRPFPVDSPYPSVFRVIREHMPDAKLASFCDWAPINYGIIEDNLGVYKYNDKDYNLIEPAIRYINENDFSMLYFQFDSVDDEGHDHGYGNAEHLAMITVNDSYIGRVVSAIEKRGWLEDTLIIVEADHGGTPDPHHGGHGGWSDAEKYVFFAATGGNVCHTELTDMMVRDTAPAILHALGIPQPQYWNGRVPGGMFPDVPENLPRPESLPLARHHVPKAEDGTFLSTFADFEPLLFLPMESMDELPEGAKTGGKLYLVDGKKGSGMRFDDGWLGLPCPSLKEGFSMMGWMRQEVPPEVAVVFGTRGYDRRGYPDTPGFCLTVSRNYINLFCKDTSEKLPLNMAAPMPGETVGGWMFVAMTCDPAHHEMRLSVDFEDFLILRFPEEGEMLPAGDHNIVYIGHDQTEETPIRLPATLDDVYLCRKVLGNDDLRRLKAYYTHQ